MTFMITSFFLSSLICDLKNKSEGISVFKVVYCVIYRQHSISHAFHIPRSVMCAFRKMQMCDSQSMI